MTPAFINAIGGPEEACRRFCKVTLDLGDGAYGGIAVWSGEQTWVEIEVREAYKSLYLIIRPALCRIRGGGGISLKALLKVASEMAAAANHDTGQNSRLKNDTLMERTGYCKSTVQRAKLALKMLGVATEVLRGRLRRWKDRGDGLGSERMGSYRVGDRSRGWASVWALHPRKPVDQTRRSVDGSIQMAPHPPRGHSLDHSSRREVSNTKRSVEKRAASRRPETRVQREKAAANRKGVLLAARWLGSPRTAAWARQHTSRGWGPALAESAAHGWTAADLNDTIDTWAAARRVTPTPKSPIAFVRWLLGQQDLAFPPHVLAQIAFDQEKAERERQAAEFAAERARYADAAGPDSPGRRAARAAIAEHTALIDQRRRDRRQRETQQELVARAELVARRRKDQRG
ncbi:replication protein [Rhodococcus sp. NM-2]|uniref:replication protein n=1 Tax=Rhodococcus sp. NM-2 TaxID=3401174 RepID=UPI003AB1046E